MTASDDGVYHSYDSGNIALAVQDYNISEDRPHLPGYFIYVLTIKIVNIFTDSTHLSIVLLMAFFSAIGSALFYLLSLKFFERNLSLLLTVLLATNPLVMFYGSVTEVYSFDLMLSAIFVLIGLNKRHIWLLPLLLAFAAGFRASSAIILLPLFVYFLYLFLRDNGSVRVLILSCILGLVALLLWVLPLINIVGGWSELMKLISTQSPVPNIGIMANTLQMMTMALWFFIPICLLLIFKLLAKYKTNFGRSFTYLILFWLIPAVIVFISIHYTRGYWLIAIAACYLLIGSLSNIKISKLALFILLIIQSSYFLFMPFKLSSPEIFYKPHQRSIGPAEVIWDRFTFQNSLTLGHINYIEDVQESIRKQIDGEFKHKYLLLDPTIITYARALQPTHPDVKFAELNLVRPDGYFIYEDMKQINLTGREELLSNSLIAGIPSFVRSINGRLIEIVKEEENVIFYRVKDEGNEEIRKIFDKYF